MSKEQNNLTCPDCGNSLIWKDGVRSTRHGEVQRYICRSCGFRFSESTANSHIKCNVSRQVVKESNPGKNFPESNILPIDLSFQPSVKDFPFQVCEDVSSHRRSGVSVVEKGLNELRDYNRDRRVCVSEIEAKNLVEVKPRTEKRAAGATEKLTEAEVKGKLVEYSWWMKKQAFSDYTIRCWTSLLQTLVKRGANLFDPETVKDVIAQQSWKEGSKRQAVAAYDVFALMNKIEWYPPDYRQSQKLPFIPTESEIDQLIAGCSQKVATFLQTLKETAARSGEAWQLRWIDIDTKNNVITINSPEKNGNPRKIKVSSKLIAMLSAMPKNSERVFGNTLLRSQRYNFIRQRRRIAERLQNPRILKITFHTLRHWKATMEYHRTKDILHVKQLLGHTNINATLIYTHLVNFESDEYHVRIAKTLKEACELAEAGFDYFTTIEDAQIFRKRK